VNKGRNKVQVLGEMKLEYVLTRPVVFCEDVPGGDTSIETLLGALPALIRNDITLIVSGPRAVREVNQGLLEPFSQQVKWLDSLAPQERRRLLAASDFYLSLNRRDPSGQRLLQASRYGAIPICFRTDAVIDVVVDADAELRTGTGIVFESMTQRALVSAMARAISAYRSDAFLGLLHRVMRQDLGWDRSARRHIQLYRGAASAHSSAE
jgi:starch synthase